MQILVILNLNRFINQTKGNAQPLKYLQWFRYFLTFLRTTHFIPSIISISGGFARKIMRICYRVQVNKLCNRHHHQDILDPRFVFFYFSSLEDLQHSGKEGFNNDDDSIELCVSLFCYSDLFFAHP